jgi:hypothetical protein
MNPSFPKATLISDTHVPAATMPPGGKRIPGLRPIGRRRSIVSRRRSPKKTGLGSFVGSKSGALVYAQSSVSGPYYNVPLRVAGARDLGSGTVNRGFADSQKH